MSKTPREGGLVMSMAMSKARNVPAREHGTDCHPHHSHLSQPANPEANASGGSTNATCKRLSSVRMTAGRSSSERE